MNDETGGNPGTAYNGVSYSPGKVDQAFSLDGSGGHIRISDAPNLQFPSGLTVEAWIKPSAIGGEQAILVKWGATGGQAASQLCFSFSLKGNGHPYLLVSGDGTASVMGLVDSTTGVPTGQWSHVAGVYDGSVLRIYVNGALAGQTAYSAGIFPGSDDMAIGGVVGGAAAGQAISLFGGLIDEVAIYNRALTDAEIAQIVTAGSVGRCKTPIVPSITTQPASQTVTVGFDATFHVVASGRPLNYQWQFNHSDIAAATNDTLVLTNVQLNQSGTYSVIVSNAMGIAPSSDAILTVTTTCISAPAGLISWWPAEGDGTEQINGNNAVLQGGVTFAPGETGQAFSFDGTSGYISVNPSPTVDLGANPGFTTEGWIKPTDTSAAHCIAEWNDGSGGIGVQFWHSDPGIGGLGAMFANLTDTSGGGHVFASGSGVLTTTNFQHVALVYNSTNGVAKIFRNGTNVASSTLGQIRAQTTFPLYFGKRVSGSGPIGYFKGLMDDLAFYSRALSDSEIRAIFVEGNAGKNCIAPEILTQPQPQNVRVRPGTNVTFSVASRGTAPLNYQWRLNGANLTGATNSSLTVSNVQPSKAGNYSVRVTNPLGFTISSNATLKVDVLLAFGNGQAMTNAQANFSTQATIQLQNLYTNGDVFYTLDGSTPTFYSQFYTGPFVVTHNVVLRALGYSADFFEAGELDPISINIVPTYSLSVTNGGGGSVTLNPSGGVYLSNTTVTATAVPASGWTFLQWLGDVSSNNASTSITMNRNKGIKAIFGTRLNTTAAGGGSVVLNPPGGTYPYGSIVWLSAIPQPGNFFVLWGNGAGGNLNPLSFGITNPNPSVSSLFSSVGSGQASLAVVPAGNGRVTLSPRTNIYNLGATVTVTATADPGQSFIGWSGDASGATNPLSVTMNQSKVIYANFSHQASLSVRASSEGLKPEGFVLTLTGDFGAQYAISASPNLSTWSNLATVTNPFGTVQFTDTAATNLARRFYRAVTIP